MMNVPAHSAIVIPFPRTPAATSPAAVPADRLALALAALTRAVEEQRRAVADWRAGLHLLDQTVSGLGSSVTDYRAILARTASEAAAAGRVAREAEARLARF